MDAPVIDFSNFGTELMKTVQDMGGNIIIVNSVMDGVASLQNDFTTELIRDRGLLVSAEFIDSFKAASDTFAGQNAMTLRTRYATFTEGDIDLKITYEDIKKAYRTYLGWVMEPSRTEAEVRDNPFELFFVRRIIAAHFQFVRLKTAWKGVFNPTPVGSENIADGFLKKFAIGRAAGGDIKSSHVHTAPAGGITDANAYDEVNAVAQLLSDTRPDLLTIPTNFYLSQNNYDKYRKARRALYPTHVSPSEKPTVLDDFTNISFVVDPGLAGKDTMAITPKENLKFIANEAPGVYSISVVKQVKHWEVSIRVSVGFDYATPELLFLNDKV